MARQENLRCAYPGCENELRPGNAGTAAEPGYCELPDPVTGEPHTALTAFRRRQMLARQGGGVAGSQDLGRPGFVFWRRRQRAEADAREAHSAALQADAQLAEALAAKAAAEREEEAAQARAAETERAAEEQVAAARQERDAAVSGAESRAAEAESRAGAAEQDAGQAREAAESAPAEHAEAESQRARAERDSAAGQAARQQPRSETRRSRRSRKRLRRAPASAAASSPSALSFPPGKSSTVTASSCQHGRDLRGGPNSGTWAGILRAAHHIRGYGHGLGVPDVAAVVADGAVGGEET